MDVLVKKTINSAKSWIRLHFGIMLLGEACIHLFIHQLAQLAGAAEYTNCSSAEENNSPNECPGYDTKQSDDEAPVMLTLWGTRSTPLLPSLLGPL